MDINIIIGNGIRFYRKKRKIKQEILSKKLDVARKTISAYENGKNAIPIDKLIRLCEILEIKIDNIISDKILKKYKKIDNIYE